MLLHRFVSLALAFAFMASAAVALAAPPAQGTCPPEPDPPNHELLQSAQQQATDRGFLWRISRDGRESYLYGSMHAGRSDWFALGPQTEASLSRAGVLALEINLTDSSVQEALRSAMQGPARPLPAAVRQSLRLAWVADCLPEAALAQGAVELHVMQLAVAQAQRLGLFTLYSAESMLLMHSMHAQRPVVGLESVQTQLSALMARNDEEAATMVNEMLAELQRPRSAHSLERLAKAWANRDLKDLEAYADWCDCLNTPQEREMYARLLEGRNPGLAVAIERLHGEGSVFAAVGALHMVGPQGLPALIESKGFKLSRVF